MAGAGLWWQRAVGVLVICCAQVASAAGQARLVVVPSQRTQAADALASLVGSMAAPLAGVAVVVPTAQYTQAAQLARMGPNLASGSAGAVLLGTQVGATHALYLRAAAGPPVSAGKRRKRAQPRLTLVATLVDTATGETLMSMRYPAGVKGFEGPEFVPQVVADVKAALSAAPAAGALAEAAAVQVPAAVTKEDVRQANAPAVAATGAPSALATPPTPVSEIRPSPVSDPYTNAISRPSHRPAMALGLRVQLGLMVYGREATLASLGAPKMQYGFNRNAPGAALSQGTLGVEIFPVQMARRNKNRSFADGLGLHFAGRVGWPKTRISTTATATSLATNLRVGLTYRHLFGSTDKSPEAAFRLGYSRYAFSVPKASVFPSLSYSSVYLDISGDIPLGTPIVALTAEAALMPALHVANQGALLGVHRGGGVGAWVEAGLRLSPVRHFDILALFDWQHYGADFVGSTVLPNSSGQYANVTLREVSLGGRLAVGLTF